MGTQSPEIHNGHPIWHKSDPTLPMAIYTNNKGKWAVAVPEKIKDNVNVMFTDVHGGQPPSGLDWYIRKGGITQVIEGVTSRLHIVEASEGGLSQERAPARAHEPEDASMVRAEALP